MACNDVNGLTEDDIDQMLKDGVSLAREAVDSVNTLRDKTKLYVVSSIGCYGSALADGSEYTGNYGVTAEILCNFYRRKVRILLTAAPDALAFETIPCVIECTAILSLLREFKASNTLCPCWLSFSCKDGERLNDGSLLLEALTEVSCCDPNVELVNAVGINCFDYEYVVPLLKVIVEHMISTGQIRTIVFYPNAGEEWDAETQIWTGKRASSLTNDFAEQIMRGIHIIKSAWHEGRNDIVDNIPIIVGGCCKTTPECISALRESVDMYNIQNES